MLTFQNLQNAIVPFKECHTVARSIPFYGTRMSFLTNKNVLSELAPQARSFCSTFGISSQKMEHGCCGKNFLTSIHCISLPSLGIFAKVNCRTITKRSKLGKRKSVKAVVDRFRRTGSGKLKRWRCGTNHRNWFKSRRRRQRLKKPVYITGGKKLKLLNQMMYGW